ncbi:MAG: hypothetical protein ACPGTP_07030 [Bacteroidia bacterium]
MKQFWIITLLLFTFSSSYGQLDMGTHLILGYGAGSTGIKNAYSAPYISKGNGTPSGDYLNDRFNYSSWMFKVSHWDENLYVDNELSVVMSAIPGIAGLISGNGSNKSYLPNSGYLRKIDDNSGSSDAEAVGLNAPIFMFDIAAGGSGWYGGLIWGYSLWGMDDVRNISVGSGTTMAMNEEMDMMQHLGLSLKKSFESPVGPTMASLEVNRLSKLQDGQPDLRRKGIESVLSLRAYTDTDNGAFKGIYAEAYYRFQTLNTYKAKGESDIPHYLIDSPKPNITMSSIGIKVGGVLSWW